MRKMSLVVLLGRDLQKTNVVHRPLQEAQAICNISKKKVMVEIKMTLSVLVIDNN